MFWQTFRFELLLRFRSWTTYLLVLVLAGFTIRDMMGGYWDPLIGTGRVARNSAYSAHFYVTTSIFWCSILSVGLMTAPLLRDLRSGMAQVVYATRVTDVGYLLGKYCASMLGLLFIVQGTVLGFVLLSFFGPMFGNPLPGEYGATPWFALLQVTLLFTIPGALLHGTLHFLLAAKTGKSISSFVVAALFTMLWALLDIIFADASAIPDIVAMIDPIGRQSVYAQIEQWRVDQRAFGLLDVSGPLLINRLLYLGVTAGLLAWLIGGFKLRKLLTIGKNLKPRARAEQVAPAVAARTREAAAPRRDDSVGAWLSAAIRNGVDDMRLLLRDRVFLLLLAFTMIGAMTAVFDVVNGGYGTGAPPALPYSLETLRLASIGYFLSAQLATIFFAGEMAQRERIAKINLIVDATPMPDWAFITGKAVAAALLALCVSLLPAIASVSAQLLNGRADLIDVAQIARVTLGYNFPCLLVLALFSLGVHILVRDRMGAHFIAVFVAVFILILEEALWIENSVLLFGFNLMILPASEFSLFGGEDDQRSLMIAATWLAAALSLLWLGYMFGGRGAQTNAAARVALFSRRLKPVALAAGVGLAVALVASGRSALHSIVVANHFETRTEELAEKAAYENTFAERRVDNVPIVTDVRLAARLEPDNRRASYIYEATLRNDGATPIADLMVELPEHAVLSTIRIADTPALETLRREDLRVHVHALPQPLAPGESIALSMEIAVAYSGYANEAFTGPIMPGVAVLGPSLLPRFGYDRRREVQLSGDRRRLGLPERARFTKETRFVNAAPWAGAGPVAVQVEAPDGYVTIASSGANAATDGLFAAAGRYIVTNRDVNVSGAGVRVSIYAHPRHARSAEAMLDAAETALQALSSRLGGYPFDSLHIVEIPTATGQASVAAANVVALSEADGWAYNTAAAAETDHLLYALSTHIAAGWRAATLRSMQAPGAPVLDAGVPSYLALGVLADRRSAAMAEAKAQRLMDDYFIAAAGDESEEQSLLAADDQRYIAARAALALLRIEALAGRAPIDAALRDVAASPPRSARTLHEALAQAAPAAAPVINDAFGSVLSFENAILEAHAVAENGGWRTRLRVLIAPMQAGRPARATHSVPIDFALSGANGQARVFTRELSAGEHEITEWTAERPDLATLDPRLTLLDRTRRDNQRRVVGG